MLSAIDPQFQRASTVSLFGKSDSEIRFRVDDVTHDLVQKLAQEHGMSTTDFARMKFLIALYGIDHVRSLSADLVDRVASSGVDRGE